MTPQDAIEVIVCLLNRAAMSKAEMIAANEAIKALTPKPETPKAE
jgi:hypothetical protein